MLTLNAMYEEIQQEMQRFDKPEAKLEHALYASKKLSHQLTSDIDWDNLNAEEKDNFSYCDILFNRYLSYKIILAHDYICKEVSPEFLLFIPRHLIQKSKTLIFQDYTLGLKFTHLPDYDYKIEDPYRTEILNQAIARNQQRQYLLSSLLLQAFKKLTAFNTDRLSMLPFINIVLDGHGTLSTVASISTIPNQDDQISDFIHFLDICNTKIRTKSIISFSCMPGGKKVGTTFNIQNQFANIDLEKITYPLLFVGSFFTETSSFTPPQSPFFEYREHVTIKLFTDQFLYGSNLGDIFTKYFYYINQTPPDYKAINKLFVMENSQNNPRLFNYVSIKFPNLSWLTPAKLDHTVQEISQIQATTHSTISIGKDIKMILMGANNMQTINLNHFTHNIPSFLPVNHANQHYVIEQILAPNLMISDHQSMDQDHLSFHQLMNSFLPLPRIDEPVYLLIKKLKLKNGTYTNIITCTDMQDILDKYSMMPDEIKFWQAGYIYTNPQGETNIVAWDKETLDPIIITEESLPVEQLKKIIANIEGKAKQHIKSFKIVEDSLRNRKVPTTVQESIQKFNQNRPHPIIPQKKYKKTKKGWIDHPETQTSPQPLA